MSQPWYEIRAAKSADAAEIYIFGDIGETWWSDESVTAKKFVEELNRLDARDITVRINSYGGSVADGLAIYSALSRSKASITTSVEGVAMSIASLIMMAGESRQMAANGLMMIHAPWGLVQGNAADMRDMAETLDKYAEAMASAYTRSGQNRDQVLALLKDGKDHFYTADEALAAGYATEVTGDLAIAAQYRDNRFMPSPQAAPSNSQRITKMTEKTTAAAPESAAPKTPPPDVASIEAAAADRERTRIQARAGEIRQMFKAFAQRPGIADLMAEMLDDVSVPIDQVSSRLLTKLGEGAEPLAQTPRIEMGQTADEKFHVAAVAAIRARSGQERHDPQNEWTGRKLSEMARAALELRGVNCRGKLPIEIASMALTRQPRAYGQTTSDFDAILENTLHKTLLDAWMATPDTWSKICKTGSVGDLRAWNRINPGTIGDIDTVNESGEYKFKTIPDGAKESITAVRRGNRIAVTPEVIINDDLSYFSDVPTMFGRAARRSIESAFYALLTSNSGAGPVMNEDGLYLFHATHNNYITTTGAGSPSIATVDAGRIAMAAQTDISGNEILDIKPAIFLGPLSHGSAARTLNNSQYDPDTTGKGNQRWNPAQGLFAQVIDTGRLTGTPWYMFADPAVMPTFEVVFLDGQNEPGLTQQEDFATAGLVWRVELPFGVGAIGWRGAYQNDGTA